MRKLIMLLLLVLTLNSVRANNAITITFFAPQANQVTDSSLFVEVNVVSTFQISTVIANVQGQQAILEFNSFSFHYEGHVSLAGLTQGIPLLLTVTVTDVFNTQQSISENILYIKPPTVIVELPAAYSNAYPSIHIKAHASSIDTCTLRVIVRFNPYDTVFDRSFTDVADTIINVSPLQTGYGVVSITATDRWAQTGYGSSEIFFDNSIYLSEVFSGPGYICDFNYGRVLTANDKFNGDIVNISDLNTQTSATLTGFYVDDYRTAFLTPNGAISEENSHTFEWNNGTLSQLWGNRCHAAGIYETYVNQDSVFIRNINTLTTTLVAADTIGQYHENYDLCSDGTVIYGGYQNNYFFKYKNGIHSWIPGPFTGRCEWPPLVDSGCVVFMTRDLNVGDQARIYFNDGSTTTLLSYMPDFAGQPNENYRSYYNICGKSAAYIKPATAGVYQVWLRDSTGATSQRTFFGTTSTIMGINPRGDIMFGSGGRLYLVKVGPLQPPVDYGPVVGRVVYRDSSWYVITGANLYRLLVDAYTTVADGNWNNPATWAGGIVPPPNSNVIILNNVIVNVNATCNTLNVHAPGSITVLPGITLTILH